MDLKTRKNKHSYTIRDMYKPYMDEYNDVDLSYFDFKRVLSSLNKLILEQLQNASECFKMPYGLGYLCVVKYKPKTYTKHSLSPDFKACREYGKVIYHLDEHSDGYKFRLFWSKIPRTFPDRYKYNVSFVRANKRRLA